jgi:hypothetical protein
MGGRVNSRDNSEPGELAEDLIQLEEVKASTCV